MTRPYSFKRSAGVSEITIDRFAGVDFATHPTKVDFRRSPDSKNMIADEAFFPMKRPGYERALQFPDQINGLHRFDPSTEDPACLLCHSGTELYTFTAAGEYAQLCSDMADAPSRSFVLGGRLYILDGQTYRVFDGASVRAVSQEAFVPTTTILSPPDGGGVSFEAVNLLTPKRVNTFIGDGSSKVFALDAQQIDDDAVSALINGTATSAFTVNREAGTVTFTAAPPNGQGCANVTISFSKTVSGYAEKINRCKIFGIFGGRNDTRVFLSGNEDFPNTDWQSGLYDPTYFPDTGYTRIGADSCAIKGYLKQYESQIVIKEGNGQDSSQYLRTFSLDGDGNVLYPLKQGAQGYGAVSSGCFALLDDLPLYLSSQGVMAVVGTDVAQQCSMFNISRRINPRLCAQDNLQNAFAIEFEGRYYLAAGGNCYVADSRQFREDGQLEWYFWDNIPARCFLEHDGNLFFGTGDGRICRFFRAGVEWGYNDDGRPIEAYWSTPFSPLGQWSKSKTILDFCAVLMPYSRSGADVLYNTEDLLRERALSENVDVFSFVTMDFNRFTFRTIKAASPYLTGVRVRDCYLFQGVVKNDRPDEAFGLLGITIKYQSGRTVKGGT